MRTCGLLVMVAIVLASFPRGVASQSNVEVLSRLNPSGGPSGVSYMDIWGYSAPDGTELAILCAVNGTIFVDVTNPVRPEVVLNAFGPASTHRDARTHGAFAYVVNETAGGLQIFDLTDARNPQLVGNWNETFDSAHNIGIYDGYAYIAGSKKDLVASGMRILDLSDPLRPVDVGATHEIPFGGNIRFWDVTDLAQPRAAGAWDAGADATVHNVFVRGDTAYASYYAQGIQVLDISEPTAPQRVAFYDTRPGITSGLEGVWGIYPFAASGNVYFSDMQLGLFVVRITGTDPVVDAFRLLAPEPQTALPGAGGPMLFSFQILSNNLVDETFSLTFTNNVGWEMHGPQTLFVAAQGVNVATLVVDAPGTLEEAVEVQVTMCALAKSSRASLCATSEAVVPVVLQAFTLHHDVARGVVVRWDLQQDASDDGTLRILRSDDTRPRRWQERAQLPLASRQFLDPGVGSGSWVYALLLDNARGTHILAEATLDVGVPVPGVRVLGNVPNPFNPSTRIRFELDADALVAVRIFDARGRLLRNMWATLPAGERSVLWDGRDHAGRPQPSGVYLYEVRTRGQAARARMTLLR